MALIEEVHSTFTRQRLDGSYSLIGYTATFCFVRGIGQPESFGIVSQWLQADAASALVDMGFVLDWFEAQRIGAQLAAVPLELAVSDTNAVIEHRKMAAESITAFNRIVQQRQVLALTGVVRMLQDQESGL